MNPALIVPLAAGSFGLVNAVVQTALQRAGDYFIKHGTGAFKMGTSQVVEAAIEDLLESGKYRNCLNAAELIPNSFLNDLNSQFEVYTDFTLPKQQCATVYVPRDLFPNGIQTKAPVYLVISTAGASGTKPVALTYNFSVKKLGIDQAAHEAERRSLATGPKATLRRALQRSRFESGFSR